MKHSRWTWVAGAALLGLLSSSGSSARVLAQHKPEVQTPRFEENVVVTATPRPGAATDLMLTFSGPVRVPGVSLPAGTYLFRLPAPARIGGDPAVIQVLKADRSNVYSMFFTIPVQDINRDIASDSTEVTWDESPRGTPPAIRALFLPHESTGYEFLYPKDAASKN